MGLSSVAMALCGLLLAIAVAAQDATMPVQAGDAAIAATGAGIGDPCSANTDCDTGNTGSCVTGTCRCFAGHCCYYPIAPGSGGCNAATCCSGSCYSTSYCNLCALSATFTAPLNGTTFPFGTPVNFTVDVTDRYCSVPSVTDVAFTFSADVQVMGISGSRGEGGREDDFEGGGMLSDIRATSQNVPAIPAAAGNLGQGWLVAVGEGTVTVGARSFYTTSPGTTLATAVPVTVTWAPKIVNSVATLLLTPATAHRELHDGATLTATALDAFGARVPYVPLVVAAHGDCAPRLAQTTTTTDAAGQAVFRVSAGEPGAVAVVAAAFAPSGARVASAAAHIVFYDGDGGGGGDDSEYVRRWEREYYYGTAHTGADTEAYEDNNHRGDDHAKPYVIAPGSDAELFAATATKLALEKPA